MSKTKQDLTAAKSFNVEKFTEQVVKGAIVGSISTTATFFGIDKPLAHATKAAAEKNYFHFPNPKNFLLSWNNSLYVNAYRATWQHPVKGYSMALFNSCMKNIVLFPTKYVTEKVIYTLTSSEEAAKNYSGFLAGMFTVYGTTPISVLKTRMMTNVPLKDLSINRLMSGVNAIALRDGIQYGIYFNTLELFKEKMGDNFLAAGAAGILGYTLSNPLSVIGLNQKTSIEPLNIADMGKKIYKANGVKGFYPLIALSAFGMFARGVAISKGLELYDSITESQAQSNKAR
ncbi:Mitochondrial carrier protein [Legionella beliardensis]|uniref:Mitochondrial carrier protein n=1 Tax=Legionella beliardensis TaxID=91822 RepID=A0A378I2A3_9GAMM|nr:MC/SLC25 family protein [Legionella beliardensis]STX28860.1 Mitochondrial carrier protein [Legionella beliardensis]